MREWARLRPFVAQSTSTRPQTVKRADLYLTAVVCLIAGLFLGLYFGRTFATSIDPLPRAVAHPVSSPSQPDGGSDSAAAGVWDNPYGAIFENAPPGQPTPGLKEVIVNALKTRPNYCDQARLLLLIESMRKEDFPIAIEVLRRAKSSVVSNSTSGTGPVIWVAFWQRFGEIDPEGALAAAIKHRDINYSNREYLEKYLFVGMARKDPKAAAEAFLAHPELPNPHKGIEGVMREWAKVDQKSAVAWAQENLPKRLLGPGFYAATMGLGGENDITEVTAFVRAVPEGIGRNAALQSAKDLIGRNLNLPAQQLLDFVTATRSINARDKGLELQLAKRCSMIDPYLAANYFSAPLAQDQQSDYRELRAVLQTWIQRDPNAAESWAKGQKGSPHYRVVEEELTRKPEDSAVVVQPDTP